MKTNSKESTYFYILIRSWNSFKYLKKSIDSALSQNYKRYKILFVDDSSDYTKKQIFYIREELKEHVAVFNKERKYSVYNGCKMLSKHAKLKNSVILVLDGDDWLLDNNVLNYLNDIYSQNDIYLTYGECLMWKDGKTLLKPSRHVRPNSNTPYPKKVVKNRSFRKEPFLPSHPMTFKKWLFDRINEESFKEPNGVWLKYAFDLASFLPMMEIAREKIKVIKEPLSIYNMESSKINIKTNPYEFVREDLIIRKKQPYEQIK